MLGAQGREGPSRGLAFGVSMKTNYMLAAVGPLETFDRENPPPGFKLEAKHMLIDRLLPSLCVPPPVGYARLSEMLADGWTVTAMLKHPASENSLIATLVRG